MDSNKFSYIYERLSNFLIKKKYFRRDKIDYTLFIKKYENNILIV